MENTLVFVHDDMNNKDYTALNMYNTKTEAMDVLLLPCNAQVSVSSTLLKEIRNTMTEAGSSVNMADVARAFGDKKYEMFAKIVEDISGAKISGYDVIIGYRADDSYFSFAQDFVSGLISFQKLSEAMRLGKLGEQIVLKSEKAFQQLKFIGYEVADAEEYYIKKNEREREARKEYRRNKKGNANINDLFMIDIMREGIQNGDARLSI